MGDPLANVDGSDGTADPISSDQRTTRVATD